MGKCMKIYIAGKITGDPNYKERFGKAENQLKEEGHIVLNPAILPEGLEPKDYMRICFAMIDISDKVLFLADACQSDGAMIEYGYCRYIQKSYEFANI